MASQNFAFVRLPLQTNPKKQLAGLKSSTAFLYASGSVLHHDLDRVLDPVAGVADRGRHFRQGEGVGVDQLRLEALLCDQRGGAVRRALAFAADAEDVDVVAHE